METPKAVLDAAKLAMDWDGHIAPEDKPAFAAWKLMANWFLGMPSRQKAILDTVADLQEAVRVLLRDAVPVAASTAAYGCRVEMTHAEWDKLVAARDLAVAALAKSQGIGVQP